MDLELPGHLVDYLAELDDFIERVIKPLEERDDNGRFFDHRREDARTDWDRGGLPNEEQANGLCVRRVPCVRLKRHYCTMPEVAVMEPAQQPVTGSRSPR